VAEVLHGMATGKQEDSAVGRRLSSAAHATLEAWRSSALLIMHQSEQFELRLGKHGFLTKQASYWVKDSDAEVERDKRRIPERFAF